MDDIKQFRPLESNALARVNSFSLTVEKLRRQAGGSAETGVGKPALVAYTAKLSQHQR
jgi:hypothetical protein